MTRRKSVFGIAILLCSVSLLQCEDKPNGTVVAQVGDAYLTTEALSARIPSAFFGSVTASKKRQLVESGVEEELLHQEAQRPDLQEDPEVTARIDLAVRQLLVAELLARTYARDTEVLEGEILDYYESHRDDFLRDQPEIRVRHIVVKDKDALNKVWERLRDGDLFEQVAREESIDASAEDGGDLGYFTEDMVDPTFWEACQAAKLGRRTRAATKLGHHVLEVQDRRDAGSMRDLVDVRADIRQRLQADRRQEQREKLLNEVRSRVKVALALEKVE